MEYVNFGLPGSVSLAVALYIACVMNGERWTQKVNVAAAGVTEVTIRNLYKGLKEALDLGRLKPARR